MEKDIKNNLTIGIRKEDKNKWEKRTPLTPTALEELQKKHELKCFVQPSPTRIFSEDEYTKKGITLKDDLSQCKVVFAVKEIPEEFIRPEQTYVFFSHTIKGQAYNMPLLKNLIKSKCTLIDYERIVDTTGKRIIFFGRYAGLAGMIDTLWALGKRLEWENVSNPFSQIKQTYQYSNLEEAKECILEVSEKIKNGNIPESISPFICGFAGYGNVSKGAQEIYDLFPIEEITPSELLTNSQNNTLSRNKMYKVVFKEKDIVEPIDKNNSFVLNDYYTNPEKYKSQFNKYIQHLTLLINANYWDNPYPRIITKKYFKNLFNQNITPKLRIIGDISCDVEGSVEFTTMCTSPDNPVYVYNPINNKTVEGVEGQGIVIMAVDNLPCELPLESSKDFSDNLKKFVPDIVRADYASNFKNCVLPDPIKKAVIVYKGELTPDYKYLNKFITI